MATAVVNPDRSATSPALSRPRTAFVLAGGASLGALQVGMLQALYEQGVVPDLLVGTSVGALNAAFVASREQNTTTATALARVWRGLEREDVFPVSLSALVGGLCGRRDHLVPECGLRRLVRRHVELDDLADAPIPLHLVTFDLAHGREVLLSEGPAVELGAERIYVLPTGNPSERRLDHAPKTAPDAAMQAVGLLVQSRLEADISRYSPEVELIVLPAPNPRGVQPTSFEHSAHLIVNGRNAARDALKNREGSRRLRLAG